MTKLSLKRNPQWTSVAKRQKQNTVGKKLYMLVTEIVSEIKLKDWNTNLTIFPFRKTTHIHCEIT